MTKFRSFILMFLSVSFFSCKWEKVDYGLSDEGKSLKEKISSIIINGTEIKSMGLTEMIFPVQIKGLYKDADKYKISEINSLMKVFYKPKNEDKLHPVEANLMNNGALYLEVKMPALVSDGSIILFLDGEKRAEKEIKVADIEWSLEQTNGDADSWTDRAKIHFKIKRTNDSDSFISGSLIATIKEEGGLSVRNLDIDSRADEETIEIDNLKPSTSYIVTYSLNGTDKSISKKITTERADQVPNGNFEQWSESKKEGAYWELAFPYLQQSENTPHWDTLNKLTCRYGIDKNATRLRYRANSSTIPTSDVHSGAKAALVRTVGYGSGATAAGNLSLGVEVSLGSLYLGSFNEDILKDSSLLPNLGIPFISRPKKLSFWAKYRPKNETDRFHAEIVFLDSSGSKIAEGVLPKEDSGKTQGDVYHNYVVPIEYKVNTAKPAKMYIRFLSGNIVDNKSSNINYASIKNDSEHVGSMLFVDDVELIY